MLGDNRKKKINPKVRTYFVPLPDDGPDWEDIISNLLIMCSIVFANMLLVYIVRKWWYLTPQVLSAVAPTNSAYWELLCQLEWVHHHFPFFRRILELTVTSPELQIQFLQLWVDNSYLYSNGGEYFYLKPDNALIFIDLILERINYLIVNEPSLINDALLQFYEEVSSKPIVAPIC